ncbi:hypothetical protein CWC38_07495 [Kocuria tytonicola]|uniref:DUF3800 domain-containing protein n=1 Tax=Kocuria tytonicola TaxID=2055946 RepID=A0A3L9L8P0_9MICC|nr:DUF3800 domain-containing protein [Kocuria tytonicola]RLY95085.1 DUF3800 domain-containing protein [Kocuria tytonicola]RLZ03115.1 hypothetical protein CWC38_07495 [Kocuria tytonicola]
MLYIDDSGSVESGLVVYGWVECRPERWRHALRTILELRKFLYREYLVPPSQELHATKFVNGRSRISTRDDQHGRTEWKTLGRQVAVDCLETLARCEDLRIGAVYRQTAAIGSGYREQRAEVYRELLESVNEQHRAEDSYVLIGMDGNGSDRAYFNAHRALPLATRHVIEDPMFHDSKQSQLMQMADLVAYSAFCHLNRHQGNEFAWEWYEQYLTPRGPFDGPQGI